MFGCEVTQSQEVSPIMNPVSSIESSNSIDWIQQKLSISRPTYILLNCNQLRLCTAITLMKRNDNWHKCRYFATCHSISRRLISNFEWNRFLIWFCVVVEIIGGEKNGIFSRDWNRINDLQGGQSVQLYPRIGFSYFFRINWCSTMIMTMMADGCWLRWQNNFLFFYRGPNELTAAHSIFSNDKE